MVVVVPFAYSATSTASAYRDVSGHDVFLPELSLFVLVRVLG